MKGSELLRPDRLHHAVELLANIGILAVTVLGCAVLSRQLWSGLIAPPGVWRALGPAGGAAGPAVLPSLPAPTIGSTLSVPGVDFSQSERTLLAVLSTQCHFCVDSAPFYRRLVTQASGSRTTRVVAVFAQPADEGRRFFSNLGVEFAAAVHVQGPALGVRGTPTLLLVNREGGVQREWVGLLGDHPLHV